MTKIITIIFCIATLGVVLVSVCNKAYSDNTEQNENKKKNVISHIVFVGQKQACDCTLKRIETTWNVLNEILKAKPDLQVKIIQRDVDVEETKEMSKLKRMMVTPGIYFINKQKRLVELLQGEVTKEQIKKVIQ